MQLKLYVWEEFEPDYSSGLAVAVATDVRAAKQQVEYIRGYPVSHWGSVKVYSLNKPRAFYRVGSG